MLVDRVPNPQGNPDFGGPRLPRPTEPLHNEEEILADPARGESVPRCMTCGTPERDRNRLTVYRLLVDGRIEGGYRLCRDCVFRAQEKLRAA